MEMEMSKCVGRGRGAVSGPLFPWLGWQAGWQYDSYDREPKYLAYLAEAIGRLLADGEPDNTDGEPDDTGTR